MRPAEAPFEEPLVELRQRIEELEGYPEESGHAAEIARLRKELEKRTREIYQGLSRWEKTLVARHSERPHTLDYVRELMDDWMELHGDRGFAEDRKSVV